jgi:hypothetical protein
MPRDDRFKRRFVAVSYETFKKRSISGWECTIPE